MLRGSRDARAPLRGYRVVQSGEEPVRIAVRAAESRTSAPTAVTCLPGRTAQPGDGVSPATGRRVGEAGRTGGTVGPYVRADLGCSRPAGTEIRRGCRTAIPVRSVVDGPLSCANG